MQWVASYSNVSFHNMYICVVLRQCVCSSVQTDSLREFSNSLCLGGWIGKSLEPEREARALTYCAYCDYEN